MSPEALNLLPIYCAGVGTVFATIGLLLMARVLTPCFLNEDGPFLAYFALCWPLMVPVLLGVFFLNLVSERKHV